MSRFVNLGPCNWAVSVMPDGTTKPREHEPASPWDTKHSNPIDDVVRAAKALGIKPFFSSKE